MKSRRRAREALLQLLYMCDALEAWIPESFQIYFDVFNKEHTEWKDGEKENLDFSQEVFQGILDNLPALDEQISLSSTRWTIGRMARVDRNLLRLATYELAFCSDIPNTVSINEAIELSKLFGTDDSPVFINGVLDNISSRLTKAPLKTS